MYNVTCSWCLQEELAVLKTINTKGLPHRGSQLMGFTMIINRSD